MSPAAALAARWRLLSALLALSLLSPMVLLLLLPLVMTWAMVVVVAAIGAVVVVNGEEHGPGC